MTEDDMLTIYKKHEVLNTCEVAALLTIAEVLVRIDNNINIITTMILEEKAKK